MKFEVNSFYYFPTEWGNSSGSIPVYVDEFILKVERKGIALLVEPRSIYPRVYDFVKEKYDEFSYVFTHDEELLTQIPNAKLLLYGTYSVEPQEKSKAVSMICSNKDLCEGHRARRMVANSLRDKIATFGEFDGGEWVSDLGTIYRPYRFNVAMENYRGGYYFTEKVCNCFASKAIPIYYGSPHIGEYFNADGIIQATTPEEVIRLTEELLKNDIEAEYDKRRDAIIENFRRVKKFRDWKELFLNTYGVMLEEGIKD